MCWLFRKIYKQINKIEERQVILMSAIEDQTAAIAQLQTTVDNVLKAISDLKSVPNNDAQIATNTSAIQDAITKLTTAIS